MELPTLNLIRKAMRMKSDRKKGIAHLMMGLSYSALFVMSVYAVLWFLNPYIEYFTRS